MKLIEKFTQVRTRTEVICAPLETEDYIPQPVSYVSPAKWHLAHTSWFFEEMILKHQLPDYKEYHPDFSFLFNSYYNSVGTRTLRADRGNLTRPTVTEVYAYRSYVDKYMNELFKQELTDEVKTLLELGLNHEEQHQELLITDLKYILGHNPLFPVYSHEVNYTTGANDSTEWVSMDEGVYEIGFNGEGFHFDNEETRHKVFLHSYKINKGLVTNGEFKEFIDAGGYDQFQHWLDEGWHWKNNNDIEHPLHWHKIDGAWKTYTLAGLTDLVEDDILTHISFYEASAYAAWKGLRLPTEFEWEVASGFFEWGKRWEWTNSAYLPYPNFKTMEGAVGEYNGKFMVNQMVLRGASLATAPEHSRRTYRNFFHAHFQWQYTGIRLAK